MEGFTVGLKKPTYCENLHDLTLLSMALIVIIWLIFNLLVLKNILKKLGKNSVAINYEKTSVKFIFPEILHYNGLKNFRLFIQSATTPIGGLCIILR